jgi:hypothetical protein
MLTPADLMDEESGIVVLHETTNFSYWGNLAPPHIPQDRKQVPSFSQDPGVPLKRRHLDSSPTEV